MITLEEVAFGYGDADLLSGLSITLPPASFHFLTGPSGAGKTTLLKLCYGALLASSGRVAVFERDLRGLSRDERALLQRRIGVVAQDAGFLDHLSAAENVALPLTLAGQAPDARAENLAELLAWVGLEAQAGARPPELSGGERQRLAVARAVIMDPEIIIADEPTGNVDWEMGLRLLSLFAELNRMGKTILVATHDLNLIRQAKRQVAARVLRISGRGVQRAGSDL